MKGQCTALRRFFTIPSCLAVVWIGIGFDADPNPDPSFHVDADTDPDPNRHQNNVDLYADPNVYTNVGKSEFSYF